MSDVVDLTAARNLRNATGGLEPLDVPGPETLERARVLQGYLDPESWRSWCLRHGLDVFGDEDVRLPVAEDHDGEE